MKVYSSFSEWNKDQSAKNRKFIGTLERLVRSVEPHLVTSVKWGQGCFLKDGKPVIYIHAEPDHVQLGFYRGASMKDPKRLLAGKGKYVRFVRIRTTKDIDVPNLKGLIRQAAK